jgi:hypothetical protein
LDFAPKCSAAIVAAHGIRDNDAGAHGIVEHLKDDVSAMTAPVALGDYPWTLRPKPEQRIVALRP